MSPGPLYIAEPPALYRLPPLVVDCSLLICIHFNEPQRAAAEQQLSGRALHAPLLLNHEMVNIALVKQRKGEAPQAVLAALQRYRDQGIQLHDTNPMGQFELGQRYGLTAYDAAYLWLAAQLRAPLATLDRQLAQAAQAHLSQL